MIGRIKAGILNMLLGTYNIQNAKLSVLYTILPNPSQTLRGSYYIAAIFYTNVMV